MKKVIHWLDEYFEEFLTVLFLAAMTIIMGIQVFWNITLMVGGDNKISFYLVSIFKRQPMYKKMYINKDRSVYTTVS